VKSLVLENLEVGLWGAENLTGANLSEYVSYAKETFHYDTLVPGAHVALIGEDPRPACMLARLAGLSFRDTILICETRRTVFAALFRKPFKGVVAANLLRYGAGALHIRSVQFPISSGAKLTRPPRTANKIYGGGKGTNLTSYESDPYGRWPANLIMVHDLSCKSTKCVSVCPVSLLKKQLPSDLEEDRFYMIARTHEEAILFVKKLIGETV